MKSVLHVLALLVALALAFVAGVTASNLSVRPTGPTPSAAAIVPSDLAQVPEWLHAADARMRDLRALRERADEDRKLAALERRVLEQWGERAESADLRSLALREHHLAQRIQLLDAQIDELSRVNGRLRACSEARAPAEEPLRRPDWIDDARVSLRIAEMADESSAP